MKLVTYDDGKVGRVDGEEIVRLDVPTMREYFERGGADDTAERDAARRRRSCARRSSRRSSSTPPATSASTRRSRRTSTGRTQIAPWIIFFQNVDAIIGPDEPVIYPEHLTEELDYELELAVVLKKAGQVVLARGGGGLHRRLRDLQRHHRARHPARRDAVRRLQLLQGDRHVLPARAVDRHAGRDPRPARPGDGAARQRRGAPGVALEPDERDDPGDPHQLLGARLLRRRRALDRHGLRRRRLQVEGGARAALPQARRRDRGGDRADRRAAQPGHLVAGGSRRAGAAARAPWGEDA